jgi:hypothetical protein
MSVWLHLDESAASLSNRSAGGGSCSVANLDGKQKTMENFSRIESIILEGTIPLTDDWMLAVLPPGT